MTYPDLPADLMDGASTLDATTINSAFSQINALDASKVDKPIGPADVGVCWVPPAPYLANNYYYCSIGVIGTTAAPGLNTLRATPWVVVAPLRINRLICEHTAAGDAGSVLRIGVYSSDAYGRPDTLLLDAGTTSMSAAPGVSGPVVDLTLAPGLYFVAGVVQGGTTQPIMRITTAPYIQVPLGTALPAAGSGGQYARTTVTGALPTPFGGVIGVSSNTYRFGFRAV